MADRISPDELEHIAHLARLELDPSEKQTLQRDLSRILDYVAQITQLDTEDVEPMAHPLSITNVLRADQPANSYTPETALQNSPEADEQFFVVPKVLDQTPGS